ncbi:transmembrane protein, partial [Trifolium pratense]
VDLPPWFSAMSIALNSDVDLDVSRIERVPMSTLPIICFRDGGPPQPDALNITLKDSAVSGINGLDVEQCFPMQKNITMKLTNNQRYNAITYQNLDKSLLFRYMFSTKCCQMVAIVTQISPGVWFIGLFNGIGPTRTQSKMIIRGPAYSFAANITVEACTNSMMMGDFCNSPVYPFSCTTSDVNNALKATTVIKPVLENLMTCKSNFKTSCAHEGVPNVFSLDIINVAEAFTVTASDIKFNITPSNNTSGANDVSLMCFVRHGSMPSVTSYDYSSDLNKVPLVIHSPLIGRWYITIVPINLIKMQDSNVTVCYSVKSHVLQCPLGKTGPNCTMDIYMLQHPGVESVWHLDARRYLHTGINYSQNKNGFLQTYVRRGPTPFESYYLPVGAGTSYASANFPLEPLLSNSSYNGEPGNIWTYLLLDIPRGAAGGNIHVQLSSDVKIDYEVYARFGGLPSLISRDYYYANKTMRSNTSMFFMLYDSSDDKINFYIMYAREGTWGFGLRHLNTSIVPAKGPTVMSLSLERCPKHCSSHGDCKFSFDASGLTSYSFCSCDRNHGGIDCSVEIVTHQGHVRQSFFLIVSNAAAILPAYWALRQKALAEWVLFTSSGIASGLYHACDVGAWCALSFNVLQFMDFWLSFMAVISTFLYLATIDEVLKRAIHTAVAILTALMAVTNATRSSNVVLVMVIGALGLLIGWVIEMSTKYRSLSFSVRFSFDFSHSLHVIKRWLCNLVGSLLRRYHWPFALAGFSALSMAIVSWTLETSESYWFWHSFWHITIYTSSFFFLCSKANIVDSENQLPANGNYELTHQDSLPRNG